MATNRTRRTLATAPTVAAGVAVTPAAAGTAADTPVGRREATLPSPVRPRRTSSRTAARTDAMPTRLLDARPDTADFRDRMFEPTLVEVPVTAPLRQHLAREVPVLDQGMDGACTAFGLATVAHTLLRTRRDAPDTTLVSTRMLYDMARRYDEWRGESYSGSSCRGAMKGWHRHGVCSEALWPYCAGNAMEPYTQARARDAQRVPLGAYARVNHRDLVAMHAAFAQVGVLYASCAVHDDWEHPARDGHIAWQQQPIVGYHAFAIVGYDRDGFWLQNSWGVRWGRAGHGWVSYDEWLQRGSDVWVARLAAPVHLRCAQATAMSNSTLGRQSAGYAQADLRPHIISLGNDGRLRDSGRFGTSADEVRSIVRSDMRTAMQGWKKKRVLLYAHGGLVSEDAAIERVADLRQTLLPQQIYPLCFSWKTDAWTTLGNILRDGVRARSEGVIDRARDLLLDRIDDTLEPLARVAGGKALWDEMKENAVLATTAVRPGAGGMQECGGAALVARLVHEWMQADADVELHLAGHSAGSILLAPLVQLLTARGQVVGGPAHGMLGMGARIDSVTLWAPAITMESFLLSFVPAIEAGAVSRSSIFTLTDAAENDDSCLGIYNKSLLYLVARALESQPRSWIDRRLRQGTPLAGMARFLLAKTPEDQAFGYQRVQALLTSGRLDWVQAPTTGVPDGASDASRATTHGGFDNDRATIAATVARVLGRRSVPVTGAGMGADGSLSARGDALMRALHGDRDG